MASEPLTLLITKHWPYIIALVLAATLLSFGLSNSPVHLNQDELESALNAHSIAQTLHDTNGRLLPFYPQHLVHWWANPVMIYLTALFLSILPFSEISIRLVTVFAGLLTIYLTMHLTQLIFNKNRLLSFTAGVLVLTTPAFFINSRLLIDHFYSIPFVLLWLVFLKKFTINHNLWHLFISGLSLGVGLHSGHASKIFMPLYFAVTLIFLFTEIKKDAKLYAVFLAGFIIPIAVFLPSFAQNPAILEHQVSYIKGFDSRIDATKGILGVFQPDRLISVFASSYHTYFSMDILFASGDSNLIASTREFGAFLIPIFFLAVIGGIYAFTRKSDKFAKILLFGLLTYPIGPVIATQPQRISRGFVVIPFMVLLAIYGVAYLLQSKDKVMKLLLVILLIATALQFSLFLYDYHHEYRIRSYGWFNNNIGGAIESGLKAAEQYQANTVYLDQRIPFGERYSNFFQIKLGIDISNTQQLFNPVSFDTNDLTPNSILIISAHHGNNIFNDTSAFIKLADIYEPDETISFRIYYFDS